MTKQKTKIQKVKIELHDKTEDKDSKSEDRITRQNRRERFKK